MRDLGGQAQPRQVFDELIKCHVKPDDFLALTNKNGGSKFENRVHFARAYSVKAGVMTSPHHGIWGLSEIGQTANLTPEWAAEIFRTARINFSGDEDEQEAPKDDGDKAGKNYWFVGASWAEGDQTERFLQEGIWQNGYEDKFSKLVRQMQTGDRIAIKASFTRKNDVPFENYGRAASVMRIKAVGTITANRGDGLTVEVDWEVYADPRDWYFYTYRTTVARARIEEDDIICVFGPLPPFARIIIAAMQLPQSGRSWPSVAKSRREGQQCGTKRAFVAAAPVAAWIDKNHADTGEGQVRLGP